MKGNILAAHHHSAPFSLSLVCPFDSGAISFARGRHSDQATSTSSVQPGQRCPSLPPSLLAGMERPPLAALPRPARRWGQRAPSPGSGRRRWPAGSARCPGPAHPRCGGPTGGGSWRREWRVWWRVLRCKAYVWLTDPSGQAAWGRQAIKLKRLLR